MYIPLRAQVKPLVEEIRSCKPDSVAKKKRNQHFLKHSFLLPSTSCVNVCVCHCLADYHSKIQCKCNENWLWSELMENYSRHEQSHRLCWSVQLALKADKNKKSKIQDLTRRDSYKNGWSLGCFVKWFNYGTANMKWRLSFHASNDFVKKHF